MVFVGGAPKRGPCRFSVTIALPRMAEQVARIQVQAVRGESSRTLSVEFPLSIPALPARDRSADAPANHAGPRPRCWRRDDRVTPTTTSPGVRPPRPAPPSTATLPTGGQRSAEHAPTWAAVLGQWSRLQRAASHSTIARTAWPSLLGSPVDPD